MNSPCDEVVNSRRVRCYDNGGKTADRYTAVFMDEPERQLNTFTAYGMNSMPFHGIGLSCSAMPGKHLGRRVLMKDLPADCQKLINQHTIQQARRDPGPVQAVRPRYPGRKRGQALCRRED